MVESGYSLLWQLSKDFMLVTYQRHKGATQTVCWLGIIWHVDMILSLLRHPANYRIFSVYISTECMTDRCGHVRWSSDVLLCYCTVTVPCVCV